jgi:broad specificity phosphatase PhoE
LAETTGLQPIVRIDLAEFRELPDFRGFPRSILESRYPTVELPDGCTEEGWWSGVQEQEEILYERAARAATWLRERYAATDDRVLLVTHGGFGSALLSTFLGLPPCGYMRFWQANCGYTVLDVEPLGVRLFKLSCTWHIPPEDWT